GIHFRTQDFDFRLPEEGDIYTILKYLALVAAKPGKPPEAPAEETSFPIVLTAAPGRFGEVGWAAARVIGPEVLASRGDEGGG
ncbi:MAG: hypothetical protein ABSG65_21405, partial [Bryobacteraceae bacterium]